MRLPSLLLLVGSYLVTAFPSNGGHHDDKECPPFSGNFTIHEYQLYPENTDFDTKQCLLYMGALFNGTIVIYDPYKHKIVDTLTFPNISYNPTMHVGGVDYDARTGLVSIVANAGAAFLTGGQDVSGPNYAILYDPYKKAILYTIDLDTVSHQRFGGFQDLEQDPRGNVYVVGTWPSSILRISPDGKKLDTWYLPQPVNQTRKGLSGLAAKGEILLAADINGDDGGKIVRFDMRQDKGIPVAIPLSPPTALGFTDAVYLPPKYDGKVLLVSIDIEGTAVIVSRDGRWEKAEYKGIIPRDTKGDAAGSAVTASVQIAQSIYSVADFIDVPIPGGLAGNRTAFPFRDITREVETLVGSY